MSYPIFDAGGTLQIPPFLFPGGKEGEKGGLPIQ